MPGIAITLTDQGRAALVAASGTNAITIAAIGITDAAFTPATNATTLSGEIKRLTTFSGDVPDAYTIHLSIRDESADSYALRAFALYLSDGTLFGLYGNGDALIMEKAAGSILLLAVDINFSQSDATSISFGDTNFIDPPATTEVQGVVELATETEAATGTDTKRAVTPKGMLAAVTKWLDTRFGAGAPSTFIKDLLVKTGAADVLAALGIKSAALQEATAFAAASHKHAIADVTNLQVSLDAKLTATSYTAADVLAKLTSVDGSGSGLDADMLDGVHASNFLQVASNIAVTGYNCSGAVVPGSGDMAGLTSHSGVGAFNVTSGSDPTGAGWANLINIRHRGGEGDGVNYGGQLCWGMTSGFANIAFRSQSGGNWNNWYTIWNSGNDGSGSGLDADMLDGLHASSFVRNDALNTLPTLRILPTTGSYSEGIRISESTSGGYANISLGADSGASTGAITGQWSILRYPSSSAYLLALRYIDTDKFSLTAGGDGAFAGSLRASRIYAGWDSGVDGSLSCSNWFRSSGNTGWINTTYGGGWYMSDDVWIRAQGDKSIYTPAQMRSDIGFNIGGSYWCWHPGNDGAGSGMDADMLDGKHASDLIPTGSLAATGYCRLPNGLILQWGSYSVSAKSYYTLTFPIAFPTACFSVLSTGATEVGNSNAQDNGPLPYAKTQTGASIYNAAAATTAWWFAIGV